MLCSYFDTSSAQSHGLSAKMQFFITCLDRILSHIMLYLDFTHILNCSKTCFQEETLNIGK